MFGKVHLIRALDTWCLIGSKAIWYSSYHFLSFAYQLLGAGEMVVEDQVVPMSPDMSPDAEGYFQFYSCLDSMQFQP